MSNVGSSKQLQKPLQYLEMPLTRKSLSRLLAMALYQRQQYLRYAHLSRPRPLLTRPRPQPAIFVGKGISQNLAYEGLLNNLWRALVKRRGRTKIKGRGVRVGAGGEEGVAVIQETEVKERVVEVKEAMMALRGSKMMSPPPKKYYRIGLSSHLNSLPASSEPPSFESRLI